MGGIWLQRIELLSTLSEHVGSKAGLALDGRQLKRHLPRHKDALAGPGEALLRIRSEELAMMGAELLHAVGNTPSPDLIMWPPRDLIPILRDDSAMADLHVAMIDILKEEIENSKPGPLDADAFLDRMQREHGPRGFGLGVRLLQTFFDQQHQAIATAFRRVEWNDVVQLRDLFESEDLTTQYGQFIDQRFLDYLARNEQALDPMNWRKFEGLAAEFFDRGGYRVALSKGRNDDNVDIRVWNPGSRGAPLLLVQCKRQKAKVGKVVVKALYADVLEERANGGLVVTSSSLSAGADLHRTWLPYRASEPSRAPKLARGHAITRRGRVHGNVSL